MSDPAPQENPAPQESPAPPAQENPPAAGNEPAPIPKRRRGRPPTHGRYAKKEEPPPPPPSPPEPTPPPPEPRHPVKVMLMGQEATFEVTTPAMVIGGVVTGTAEKMLARKFGRGFSPEQRQAGAVAHALCADKYGLTLARYMPEAMLVLFWLDVLTSGPQGQANGPPEPTSTPQA